MHEENVIDHLGGCACGKVRFRFRGPVLAAVNCYCEDCRRATGTSHAAVLAVSGESFRIDQGTTGSYNSQARSGATTTRFFCRSCGSPLFGSTSRKPDIRIIFAATLDESDIFQPNASIFTAGAPAWAFMHDNLPIFRFGPE